MTQTPQSPTALSLNKNFSLKAIAALVSLFIAGCSNTEFGSNHSKSPSTANSQLATNPTSTSRAALEPYGTPDSNGLPQPGWVVGDIKSDLDTLFRSRVQESPGSDPDHDTDRGSNDPFASSDGVLWLPCQAGEASAGSFAADCFGFPDTKVQVVGEFCPPNSLSGQVSVLFVIDHSGSMEGSSSEGPNDPTTLGSCGRLKAADALMKKFASMKDTEIEAGVIGFSDQARVQLPLADLGTTQANLTASVFCGSDSNHARTNYAAAFSTAFTELSNRTGSKLVYFISDGSPTAGGMDPRQAGLDAAQRLRAVPDLSVYALFVGYRGGSANNPQGYLEQIAGDAKNVRVTANADELAQAATTLGRTAITIDSANVIANLATDGQQSNIKMQHFDAKRNALAHYIWLTEPFTLESRRGEALLNALTVTGKTSEGTEITSIANIMFHLLEQ